MAKRTIIEVTEPVLTLKLETGEVRVFVLRDATYKLRNHSVRDSSPRAYWYGPAIVEENEGPGRLSVTEHWPDQPEFWKWLEALTQIGLWAISNADVPNELQDYWHKADRELPALCHIDPNRPGYVDKLLEDVCTTKDVFWSRNHNSYVLVDAGGKTNMRELWYSGNRLVELVSINGNGQIRWGAAPADVNDWQKIDPNHEYVKAAAHFGLRAAEVSP